jgi:hypothetical protein
VGSDRSWVDGFDLTRIVRQRAARVMSIGYSTIEPVVGKL